MLPNVYAIWIHAEGVWCWKSAIAMQHVLSWLLRSKVWFSCHPADTHQLMPLGWDNLRRQVCHINNRCTMAIVYVSSGARMSHYVKRLNGFIYKEQRTGQIICDYVRSVFTCISLFVWVFL